MLKNNLVKGGDLDNAIVIMDQAMHQDELNRIADLFHHEHIQVNEIGILNNLKLRYDNECARHKLLDLIGDIALLGSSRRVQGYCKLEDPFWYYRKRERNRWSTHPKYGADC